MKPSLRLWMVLIALIRKVGLFEGVLTISLSTHPEKHQSGRGAKYE